MIQKLRAACLIALVATSLAGCRSPGARAPARIIDGETAEREAALKRDRAVNALDSPPEGLGKTIDPH